MGEPLSGVGGTVKTGETPADLFQVRNWNATINSKTSQFATNSSSGWDVTVAGAKNWEGSLEMVVDDSEALPLEEGDLVTAQLHGDASNYYSGEIRIESVEVEVDINEGTEIPVTVNFKGHGALTRNGTQFGGS